MSGLVAFQSRGRFNNRKSVSALQCTSIMWTRASACWRFYKQAV